MVKQLGTIALVAGTLATVACTPDTARAGPDGAVQCAPDNGGLVLPDGFCAVVVADELGAPRHLAVASNGDLYVTLRGTRRSPGSAMALRDTTGDGVADVRVTFDPATVDIPESVAPDEDVLRARSTFERLLSALVDREKGE